MNELKERHAREVDNFTVSRAQIEQNINQKRRMIGILYDDRLSGRITGKQYDEKKISIGKDIEKLESRYKDLDNAMEVMFNRGIDILEISQKASQMYPDMAVEEKRVVISSIFSSLRLRGASIEYELSPMAKIVSKKVTTHQKLITSFELSPDLSKKDLSKEVRSIWLRRLDVSISSLLWRSYELLLIL